jgi:hypothetical protein
MEICGGPTWTLNDMASPSYGTPANPQTERTAAAGHNAVYRPVERLKVFMYHQKSRAALIDPILMLDDRTSPRHRQPSAFFGDP